MKVNPSAWALILFLGILIFQIFTEIPIFVIFISIVFIAIIGILVLTKFDINFSSGIAKKDFDEILNNLNINNKKLRKLSKQDKLNLKMYSFKKQKYIERKVATLTRKNPRNKEIPLTVEQEWNSFGLEKQIEILDDEDVRLENFWKGEQTKRKKNIAREKEKADENEKRQSLIIKQKEFQRQREQEKSEQDRLREEEIKRRKRKEEEEMKLKELIDKRKKENDNKFKQNVKRQLLEKERNKSLESEAIQELIQDGLISENYFSKYNRVSIPSHVKEAVWKRDKQSCVDCGSRENLEFDHNIPVSKGGSNTVNNIQLLCQRCNRKKSNKII